MEKEVKKDKGIKIKLCVIIAGILLILIGGYFTYKYLTTNNTASKFKVTTVEINNETHSNDREIVINGNQTGVFLYDDTEKYDIVGYIDDMIVININGFYKNIYIFDENGNTVQSISNVPINNFDYEKLEKYYTTEVSVKKNEISMKYIFSEKNKEKTLCNLIKDEEIYEETDKVVYKNEKFSKKEVVSKTTNIEYREKNNIKCSNSIKVSIVEKMKDNVLIKYIQINDNITDITSFDYYELLGRIEDRIVIRRAQTFDLGNVYVFDENGNYQEYGAGGSLNLNSAKVEGNDIIITSFDTSGIDFVSSICSKCAKEDHVMEIIQKVTYKGGKFSDLETISTKTIKDIRNETPNICDTYDNNAYENVVCE